MTSHSKMIRYEPRPQLVRDLARVEAQRVGIPPGSVFARSNEPKVVDARAAVMRNLRGRGWSLTTIGHAFGLHHTTVDYHVRRKPLHDLVPDNDFRIPIPDLSGEWAI